MTWQQLSMMKPTAVRIQLTIGVIPAEDHFAVQVEATSEDDGSMLALWSKPISKLTDVERAMDQAMRETWRLIETFRDPFP